MIAVGIFSVCEHSPRFAFAGRFAAKIECGPIGNTRSNVLIGASGSDLNVLEVTPCSDVRLTFQVHLDPFALQNDHERRERHRTMRDQIGRSGERLAEHRRDHRRRTHDRGRRTRGGIDSEHGGRAGFLQRTSAARAAAWGGRP